MKKLVTEVNLARCDALKTVLEVRGIQCFIKNEYSSIEAGVTFARPELWVMDDTRFEEAQAILREEETQHVQTGDAQEAALADDESPTATTAETVTAPRRNRTVLYLVLALIVVGVVCTVVSRMRQSAADYHFRRGYVHDRAGRYDQAIAAYTEAIENRPDYWQVYYNRAMAKDEKGDLNGAIADFSHSIRLHPKDPEAYIQRGVTKGKKGDFDGAMADFNHAIKLDATYAPAYSNRGTAKLKQNDLIGAVADFTTAIELDPKAATAYYYRGFVKDRQGNLEEAMADFTRAIELDPKDVYPHLGRGNVRLEQGDVDKAAADYYRAAELEPESILVTLELGMLAHVQGHYEEAKAKYEKARQLDFENAAPHFGLGTLAHAQGHYQEALAEYQKALEIDPKDALMRADLHVAKAWSWLQLNELAHAENELAEAGRPMFEQLANAIAFDLGIVRARQGKTPEALRLWQEALRLCKEKNLSKKLDHALFNLAAGHAEAGLAEMQKILTGIRVPADDLRSKMETLDMLKRCPVKLEGLDRMMELVKEAQSSQPPAHTKQSH